MAAVPVYRHTEFSFSNLSISSIAGFIPYPDFQDHINRLHGNTLPGGNNIVRSFYAHVETFYASISLFRGNQSINQAS
jgi:hypothetical protein